MAALDWASTPAQFVGIQAFLDAIDGDGRPSFHFNHTLIPHVPLVYLPSGRRHVGYYRPRGLVTRTKWSVNQDRIDRDYQLFLLQVGYFDTMVGEVVERLKRHGLFDSSLLVITADHGASYQPRRPRRRLVEGNAAEIVPIPLFIKAPFQQEGVVDLRPIQSIDVLPTIADLYGLQIPWKMDGISAADSSWPQDRPIESMTTWSDPWVPHEFALEDLDSRYDISARWLSLFGSGYGPRFWAFGPYAHLIGTRPSSRQIRSVDWLAANLKIPAEALQLEPDADFLPAFLDGDLRASRKLEADSFLAIAINDVIRAVVLVDRASARRQRLKWQAIVPEESFQAGENRVRVFLLRERDNKLKLLEAPVHLWPS